SAATSGRPGFSNVPSALNVKTNSGVSGVGLRTGRWLGPIVATTSPRAMARDATATGKYLGRGRPGAEAVAAGDGRAPSDRNAVAARVRSAGRAGSKSTTRHDVEPARSGRKTGLRSPVSRSSTQRLPSR